MCQDAPSSVLKPFSYEPMALCVVKSPPCCHAFPANSTESTKTASHNSGELCFVGRTMGMVSSLSSNLTWVYCDDDGRKVKGGRLDDMSNDLAGRRAEQLGLRCEMLSSGWEVKDIVLSYVKG
jgi:hypothetical protein